MCVYIYIYKYVVGIIIIRNNTTTTTTNNNNNICTITIIIIIIIISYKSWPYGLSESGSVTSMSLRMIVIQKYVMDLLCVLFRFLSTNNEHAIHVFIVDVISSYVLNVFLSMNLRICSLRGGEGTAD